MFVEFFSVLYANVSLVFFILLFNKEFYRYFMFKLNCFRTKMPPKKSTGTPRRVSQVHLYAFFPFVCPHGPLKLWSPNGLSVCLSPTLSLTWHIFIFYLIFFLRIKTFKNNFLSLYPVIKSLIYIICQIRN